MKRRVLFLVLLLLPCAVLFAQEKKTIAVYVAGNEEETVKKVFASKVVSAIIGQGKYMAVERTSSFLEQIGKETSYQGSGAVSESQLSKIGQQFGASYVCAIDISILYGERFISAKFINTETAIVEVNEDISGNWNDLKGLESVAKGLAVKLVGGQKTYNDFNGLKQIQINFQNYEVLPNNLNGTYNWLEAKSACENLTAFEKSDWYLPSSNEFMALVENREDIDLVDGGYWTSDYHSGNKHATFAIVNNEQKIDKETISYFNKYCDNEKCLFYVRCVRNDMKELEAKLVGEQKAYNDPNGPRQIQINYQNYEVLPGDLDGTYTWSNAKSACANLTAFGKSDWYLPDISELAGLYKRKNEIGGFTSDLYWSSSEYDSTLAWFHSFSDGGRQSYRDKNFNDRVRCVRKY